MRALVPTRACGWAHLFCAVDARAAEQQVGVAQQRLVGKRSGNNRVIRDVSAHCHTLEVNMRRACTHGGRSR